MNIKVYDAGKKYENGDRYTVYFKIPPSAMRNNTTDKSLFAIKNYNGVWCSVQPCCDNSGVNLLAQEWLEKGNMPCACFGKLIELSVMPSEFQKWCVKKEKLWLAAWRINTEESWDRFWNA